MEPDERVPPGPRRTCESAFHIPAAPRGTRSQTTLESWSDHGTPNEPGGRSAPRVEALRNQILTRNAAINRLYPCGFAPHSPCYFPVPETNFVDFWQNSMILDPSLRTTPLFPLLF